MPSPTPTVVGGLWRPNLGSPPIKPLGNGDLGVNGTILDSTCRGPRLAEGGLVVAGPGGALHGCPPRLSPNIAVEFNEIEPRKLPNSENCSAEDAMRV